MKIEKCINLDFLAIKNTDELYDSLSKKLGFPDFFGRNINALIDCLSGLRYPEEGMISVNVSNKGCLSLNISNFSQSTELLKNIIIFSVGAVNKRYAEKGLEPALLLCLIE